MKKQFFVALSIFIIFCACKKEGDTTHPSLTCRITERDGSSYTPGSFINAYSFSYNNDGKISMIANHMYRKDSVGNIQYADSSFQIFTYNGDQITIKTNNSNSNGVLYDTIILNKAGFISETRYDMIVYLSICKYYYDSNNKVTQRIQYNTINPSMIDTISYKWENGDITEMRSSFSGIIQQNTYTNLDIKDGDVSLIDEQLFDLGAYFYRNKHLREPYTYSFDSNGNIDTIYYNLGSSPYMYKYTYSCK